MGLSLFRCISERTDEKGEHYTDLLLGQEYNSKIYIVRVRPCFKGDYKLLTAMAKPVENIESAYKCME